MNHPSEQDLVLYFYGDAPKTAALERHLAECGACAAEYASLRATLSAIDFPVPERVSDYEAQLWSTLRPRLEATEAPKRSSGLPGFSLDAGQLLARWLPS